MRIYMILFAVGPDRPGIVDDVSTFLYERGANIEDSQMAVMGGRFSIVTLFSCEPMQIETIRDEIDYLSAMGLTTSLHDADETSALPGESALPLKLDVTAMDHPGIVQRIVRVFHLHDVNIQSLRTQVVSAPLSGAPLFTLSLEAAVPAATSISSFKEKLRRQAAEMNIDLNFRV